MNWDHPEGYSIRIEFKKGIAVERRGIFLFKHKEGGIVWVESSYLDLMGGSPSLHEVIGPITEGKDWITVEGEDRAAYIGYAEDNDTRQDFDDMAKERKTTIKREQKRVKKDLKDLILL